MPGKTLLGSDSHTCAAGSLGMLAIGAGGLEVALAMAGEPFYVKMPEIWGVQGRSGSSRSGSAPKTSSSRCCAAMASPAASAHHRILRPGARWTDGHGSPRDRQHGGRAWRDHDGVPLRRGSSASSSPRVAVETGSNSLPTRNRIRCNEEIDLSGSSRSSPTDAARAMSCLCAIAAGRDLSGHDRLIGQPRISRLRCRRVDRATAATVHDRVSFDINPTSRQMLLENLTRRDSWEHFLRPVRASIRPAATAASAWGRRRPPGESACAPCRAISRVVPAPKTTGLFVQPRNRRSLGACRRDYRSEDIAHGIPKN